LPSAIFPCHFFLDKKVTKKSRQNDIQPVLPAALFNICSLVASAFDLYSLKAYLMDFLKSRKRLSFGVKRSQQLCWALVRWWLGHLIYILRRLGVYKIEKVFSL